VNGWLVTTHVTSCLKEAVDGALVNPVPVSLCRAMGADVVIAVNITKDLSQQNFKDKPKEKDKSKGRDKDKEKSTLEQLFMHNLFSGIQIPKSITDTASSVMEFLAKTRELTQSKLLDPLKKDKSKTQPSELHIPTPEQEVRESLPAIANYDTPPHIIKVITSAVTIMQQRIVTSRLASDPPEVEITPRLSIDTFDFDKAAQAIEDGRAATLQMLPQLKQAIDNAKSAAPKK
jgi:NTE family protein